MGIGEWKVIWEMKSQNEEEGNLDNRYPWIVDTSRHENGYMSKTGQTRAMFSHNFSDPKVLSSAYRP